MLTVHLGLVAKVLMLKGASSQSWGTLYTRWSHGMTPSELLVSSIKLNIGLIKKMAIVPKYRK